MFNTENLEKKWEAVLDHADCNPIKDRYKRSTIARLLENQELASKEQRNALAGAGMINEDFGTSTSSVQNFDPVLISLVRRAMPNIIAYDIAGVQPLTQPTGLIFAMKTLYKSDSPDAAGVKENDEAQFFGKGDPRQNVGPDTAFSGGINENDGTGEAITTGEAERLKGKRTESNPAGFGEMGFEIIKTSVEARSRALRATYTTELAQDLKAVHGLDAESELANILSTEILSEINREVVNGVHGAAITGGFQGSGVFDLSANSDGRWSVEKYKGLIFQIEVEANRIGKDTRRGKGNWIICSTNVASALAAAGMMEYNDVAFQHGDVDPTAGLYAGTLNGKIKVFIDPFTSDEIITIGYRGSNPYDAGVFYCPYVPLQLMRTVGEDDFQPRIGFKTRYGIRANPFVDPVDGYGYGNAEDRFGGAGNNKYFRTFIVNSLVDFEAQG